jgi:hypothetical protein
MMAAGVSYWRGYNEGIESGMEGTLGVLVKEGLLSRFVNKDGDVDFCEMGSKTETCPKCGFHHGDNLGEETP